MTQVNKDIGERIKGIRELSDLSVEALAQRVNVAPTQLALYEAGETDIPVSILHDISIELKISMTELLTGETAKLSTYSVVRANRGIGVDRREAYNYKALAYHFAGRQMDPYLITIEPKPEDTPISLNIHSGQEFHFCLEGSFLLQIDKHDVVINEGDAVYFNSKSPHGMRALNGKCARELVIII